MNHYSLEKKYLKIRSGLKAEQVVWWVALSAKLGGASMLSFLESSEGACYEAPLCTHSHLSPTGKKNNEEVETKVELFLGSMCCPESAMARE